MSEKLKNTLVQAAGQVAQHAKENPKAATAVGVGALVCAAPALVASPVLGLIGFGANGIVGGSAAAGFQSTIGSVVAPSLFATLQSAGAGGYGVSAVYGAVQGAAAVGAGGSLAASFRGKKKNPDKEKRDDDDDDDDESDADEGDGKQFAEKRGEEADDEGEGKSESRL